MKELSLKTKLTKKLKKKNILEICKLKNTQWKYSLNSQINWFNQDQENEIIKFYNSKIFGKIRSPRPAPKYSYSSINGEQLAPMLGQNSVEVLKELRFTEKEIEGFINNQITSKY